jgi:hypothetical protein
MFISIRSDMVNKTMRVITLIASISTLTRKSFSIGAAAGEFS